MNTHYLKKLHFNLLTIYWNFVIILGFWCLLSKSLLHYMCLCVCMHVCVYTTMHICNATDCGSQWTNCRH